MKHFRAFFILLAVAAMVTAGPLPAAEKIDINSASARELAQLNRIGPALADRIVEYRERHGPFERPEEITKVRGIGPKTFEAFRDRITVGEPEKKASEEEETPGKDKRAEKKDSGKTKDEKKSASHLMTNRRMSDLRGPQDPGGLTPNSRKEQPSCISHR